MNKKNKNKNRINQDRTIDSIIEETRFLTEQEEMAKEAAKISAQPKMEEIFSNKSKEIRLKSEEIENDTPCKWKSKESWNSNTLSDNIDFNIKNITRVKEK